MSNDIYVFCMYYVCQQGVVGRYVQKACDGVSAEWSNSITHSFFVFTSLYTMALFTQGRRNTEHKW